ncbi:MAG TPA: diguanylate cyclase [Thermotogota bacterium]|nr:diguanylate cyclase [Thermotogota bacterium]
MMMTYEELSNRMSSLDEEVQLRRITQETLNELLDNAIQVQHISAQVQILLGKGYIYYYEGEIKEANDYLFNALSLATEIDDKDSLIRAQLALGATYGVLGLYDYSLQYLMTALEIAQDYHLKGKLGQLYNNLGTTFFYQDLIEEAGKYSKLAYDFFKTSKNTVNQFISSLNMAVYKMRIGEFVEAKGYLQEAEEDIDKVPLVFKCALNLHHARLLAYNEDFRRSIEVMNTVFNDYFNENTDLNLYDLILEWCLVLKEKGQLPFAKGILGKSVEYLRERATPVNAEMMRLLGTLYKREKRFEEATELFQKAVDMKSDIYKKNQQLITYNALKLLDITKKNRELIDASYRDALSGCFNRHALEVDGQNYIDQSAKSAKGIAFIMFDIDYFKQYNDYYGHLAGDNCIKTIAEVIRKVCPGEERLFYRYGGDEFLILWKLQNLSEKEIAQKMLEAVRNMEFAHERSTVSDRVTVSIGISTFKGKTENLQLGIDAADINLYKAKFNRRNRACIDDLLLRE